MGVPDREQRKRMKAQRKDEKINYMKWINIIIYNPYAAINATCTNSSLTGSIPIIYTICIPLPHKKNKTLFVDNKILTKQKVHKSYDLQ